MDMLKSIFEDSYIFLSGTWLTLAPQVFALLNNVLLHLQIKYVFIQECLQNWEKMQCGACDSVIRLTIFVHVLMLYTFAKEGGFSCTAMTIILPFVTTVPYLTALVLILNYQQRLLQCINKAFTKQCIFLLQSFALFWV